MTESNAERPRTILAEKREDRRCYSCGKSPVKTTFISTTEIIGSIHLCNKCLQWLKGKLRGF